MLFRSQYGDYYSSPITISGLEPNIEYSIFARAYGNGGFGEQSNTIIQRTYLPRVDISSVTIHDVKPTSMSVYIRSTDASNTKMYEFTLCDANKALLDGPWKTNLSYYDFTGLTENTSYYIRCRVQSKDSGLWSDYAFAGLITTPYDQATGFIKINGSWQSGKIYVKDNVIWKKSKKICIKKNGIWIESINQN